MLALVPFLIDTHAVGHPEAVVFGTGIAQTEVKVNGEVAGQIELVACGQSRIPQLSLIAGIL